jgi:hypothetical protein
MAAIGAREAAGDMSRRAHRSRRPRASYARPLLALAGVALLALLALAALLVGSARVERDAAHAAASHPSVSAAVGEPEHGAPSSHALHQQPSTRARSVAFAVLAAATVVAAWAYRRIRVARSGRPRTLRIAGLPPGRGPPALRTA